LTQIGRGIDKIACQSRQKLQKRLLFFKKYLIIIIIIIINNNPADPPLPTKITQFFSSKQNLIASLAFVVVVGVVVEVGVAVVVKDVVTDVVVLK